MATLAPLVEVKRDGHEPQHLTGLVAHLVLILLDEQELLESISTRGGMELNWADGKPSADIHFIKKSIRPRIA